MTTPTTKAAKAAKAKTGVILHLGDCLDVMQAYRTGRLI